jgi:putative endonuclease
LIVVYVLQGAENGKRYVGITNCLSRRIQEHRNKKTKGGQQLRDFSVIHTETLPDYVTARKREKYLKSGAGREWLRSRIPVDRP